MIQIFKPGQMVRACSSGVECRIEQLIGGGAQGEVYRVTAAGRQLALKWYFAHSATPRQRASIENIVRKGPPNNRFLWPLELAASDRLSGFGYIMPLREERYRGVADLMKRRIDPRFHALATAGFQLAHSFLQLHSKGLCYRDIAFGNLFLDPDTGDILICDNDNVAVDGEPSSGVLGTPRFMAPEVVRGDAFPSTQTDLFSLAVLLFYLFLVHHPLEGRKELAIHSFDLPAMTRLYGTEPVFIFDPIDASNAAVRGYHDNALDSWPIYPGFLRELFIRSFTEGIRDPEHGRVREGEWRVALVRLRDSILSCAACGAENFYDAEALRAAHGNPGTCWNCGAALKLPFRIRIGRSVVMLNADTRIFPHHVDDQRAYDFSQPVAAVTRHPANPSLWGLTNLSSGGWSYKTREDPTPIEIPPGRSVALASGTVINFGKIEGEIRA